MANPLGSENNTLTKSLRDLAALLTAPSPSYSVVNPCGVKAALGKVRKAFAGYAQHDAQEALSTLIDTFHEDTNRSRMDDAGGAGCVDRVEGTGLVDEEAKAAWGNYVGHNDSEINALFAGLLRSLVMCGADGCGFASTTFDPFTTLPLPLPDAPPEQFYVTVVPAASDARFVQFKVEADTYECLGDLKAGVGSVYGIDPDRLFAAVVEHSMFQAFPADEEYVESYVDDGDEIYLYELSDPAILAEGDLVRVPVCHMFPFRQEHTRYDADGNEYSRFLQGSAYFGLPLMVCVPPVLKYSELYAAILDAMSHYVDASVVPPESAPGIPLSAGQEEGTSAFRAWQAEYAELASAMAAAGMAGGDDYDSDYDDDDDDDDESKYLPDIPEDAVLSLARAQDRLFTIYYGGTEMSAIDKGEDVDVVVSSENYVVLEWNEEKIWAAYSASKLADCDYDESLLTSTGDELEIPSLDSSLAMFGSPEVLSEGNAWYCPSCSSFVPATKIMSIECAPPRLVVQLKRFRQSSAHYTSKYDAFVDFPVDNFVLPVSGGGPAPVYRLYAAIHHFGALGGGHYIAFARTRTRTRTPTSKEDGEGSGEGGEGGEWMRYNDSRVDVVTAKDVVSSAAYILFYERLAVN